MTIIEVAIALMIGLIAVAFVIGIYSLTQSNQQLGQAQQHLSLIRNGVIRLFEDQPGYSDLTNTIAVNAGIVPDTMNQGGGTLTNVWSGPVNLDVGTAPKRFDITYEQVPQSACVELGTFSDDEASWVAVRINSTVVDGSTTSANTQCLAGNNTMTFTSG